MILLPIPVFYLDFCRWKGKPIASIRRRRIMEFSLLHNSVGKVS